MRVPLICIFLLFFFLSCEKQLTIDFPNHKSKLVLNSLFTKDSIFKVHLSQSGNVLEELPPIVSNASVKLYEDNIFLETLSFNGATYESVNKPKLSKTYKIEVENFDYKVISAYNSLPSNLEIESLSFNDFTYVDAEGYDMSTLDIEIKDNSIEKNYYELVILVNKENIPPYTVYYDENNNDPVILNEQILGYDPDYIVFSDELFNGKTYSLKVNYATPYYDIGNGSDKKITIIVRGITEDYYKYRKRLIVHTYNKTPDIWDGSGEPIQMFTNVNGGYGIFAGYSEIKREFKY